MSASRYPAPPGQPARPAMDRTRGFTRWAWLLLLTVPLAAMTAALLFFIAAISLCGISGCSGAGYGVSYSPDYMWIIPLILAGIVLTLGGAGPPWWLPRKRCWIVVGSMSAALTLICLASFALDKYSQMPPLN